MKPESISVLAVGDPAVKAYVLGEDSPVRRFERQENIKVNFEIIPWQDYYTRLITELERPQAAYDLIMVAGHFWKADFVGKGYLQELDEYFGSAPAEYDFNDILPSVRSEMAYGDHWYLVPSFSDGHLIFYRKDIVNEVTGSPLPSVISIDELIELIKKTHRYREQVLGIALKAHVSEIMLDWLPYLRQAGIDLFQDGKPSFNNELGIGALRKYCGLKEFAPADTANFGNEAIKKHVQEGSCVFGVSWGGQAGEIFRGSKDPANIGYATFEHPWNVTWSFAVNRKSLRKDWAARFLFYLSSKEIDRVVGMYAGSPVRESSYHDGQAAKGCPWYGAQLEMLKRAKPLPDLINSGAIYGHIYQKVHQCFAGEISAEEALKTAEELIRG